VVNNSILSAPIFISGNLANGVITGILNSSIIVQGNVAKFAINSDPITVGRIWSPPPAP